MTGLVIALSIVWSFLWAEKPMLASCLFAIGITALVLA